MQAEEIKHILKKYWGFDSFRPLQEDIILSVLAGNDTLALLPTGGGKSICFQVPGIALGGTTLVISPLIALMNDQVQNLKKRGISAVAISAAMRFKEIEIALENAARGHVQFLYVSPERLQNEDFRTKLAHLPITLIAVDEAHCISQWGYDFRPSYLLLRDIRQYFPTVQILALTASATQQVVDDIQFQLLFTEGKVFRQSFKRSNLRYVVQKEENKIERLMRIIKNIGGTGLVYVRNRKRTEDLAKYLNQQGFSSQAYHAGLKYDQRQQIQNDWIQNRTQIIVATNAFGMGIDKPEVRFVVHIDLPDSLEAYFQEAGRAGRDGEISYATVLFSTSDQEQLKENLIAAFPSIEQIKQTYSAVCNYYVIGYEAGQGLSVDFDIEAICRSYKLQTRLVYNSLRFLEKENYLSLLEAGLEPSRLRMLYNKEQLYDFEIKHAKYEPLIKTILRSYGGLFENYVAISEKDISYRVKISQDQTVKSLLVLHELGVIDYHPQTALPKLVFTQNRVEAKYVQISHQNYERLKEQQTERVNSVINYTNNNFICRQAQLLHYFGEEMTGKCGHCDVCITNKTKSTLKYRVELLAFLRQTPSSLETIRSNFSKYNDEAWLREFHDLIEEGVIKLVDTLYTVQE